MMVPLLLFLSFVWITTVDATCLNPSILYAPREVVAKKGDSVSLVFWMQNDGDKSCAVTWFKFDDENRLQQLQLYDTSSWSTNLNVFVTSAIALNLRNVQSSTTYRCKVEKGGFVDIHLRVVPSEDDIPAASPGERTIVYLPDRVYAHEGEEAGIICMVQSEHVSSRNPFDWYKLDDNSGPISYNGTGYGATSHYQYTEHMATHVLFIYNTTTSDAGTYRCQLNDDVYRDTRLVVLPADSDHSD